MQTDRQIERENSKSRTRENLKEFNKKVREENRVVRKK
jgi:hypothetical protein